MVEHVMDIRIVQLLFSRLCHDLAGPIGAIKNGVEFVSDFEDEDAEAIELIAQSAHQAAVELEFARLAFGFGGGRSGDYLADAEHLCKSLLANERIRVAWENDPEQIEIPIGTAKLLVNMALVGHHCLHGRGSLIVRVEVVDGSHRLVVGAEGPGVGIKAEMLVALKGEASPADLTPATSQGYYTCRLGRLLGADLEIDASADERIVLSATVDAP